MQLDELIAVHRRTIDALVQYSEKKLMPDNEFIQIVRVVIEAGNLMLADIGSGHTNRETFQSNIYQYAKSQWLSSCEKNIEPDLDKTKELAIAAKDFDYMYKKGRERRR